MSLLQARRQADAVAHFTYKADNRAIRRQLIDGMREAGLPEAELAPHEARLAAEELGE